jgi:hypothetical protein
MTTVAEIRFTRLEQVSQTTVGEPLAFQVAHLFRGQREKFPFFQSQLKINNFLDLDKEPRINPGQLEDTLNRHSDTKSISDVPQAIRCRASQLLVDRGRIDCFQVEAINANFEATQGLCSDS